MDKYTIGSACTSLSDQTITFTVACKNLDNNVIAYGSVLVSSDIKSKTNINFYNTNAHKEKIYNDMIKHCKERAKIVFMQDPNERMQNIIKQEA